MTRIRWTAPANDDFLGIVEWIKAHNPDAAVPQTWKLSPQPQRPFSFGLVKVKPEVSALTS